jgi:nucleoside-diphosphate-sugar epimerase
MLKLIFGCGYLGERVATRWLAAGHDVVVVTRSKDRAEQFKQRGFAPVVADVSEPTSLRDLPPADTVLYAVGYDRRVVNQKHTIEEIYAGGLTNVLAALPTGISRIIYISTTGVYGPASGEWVDESSPPDPQRDGGKASLAAELVLASHPLGERAIILRLAGIYGPGRVPFTNQLLAGEPIPARGSGYINLIHVEDAADIVIASERSQLPAIGPRIYCVSDGQPVQRGEVYREVARLIGAPPPVFIEPEPNSRRATRSENTRRVRNDRMMAALHVKLAYPDYRAGIAAILTA